MSSGGSKPDEVKASEGEKAQAQLARDQINYYKSTYAPLEQAYADEAGRDYSARLSGQAGTSGAREMTETLQVAGAAGAPLNTAALSSGVTSGRVAGLAEGQRLSADGNLNALKVGLGATADATRSLTETSRLQTSSLIEAQQNKLEESKVKSAGRAMTLAAIGQVGGMAAGYYGAGALANRAAAQNSLTMGASQQGYSGAYLSGWTGPSRTGAK